MALNLSLIIKAVDQATAPIRRITASTRGLASRGMGALATGARAAGRGLGVVGGAASRFDQRLTRATYTAMRFAGRLGLAGIRIGAYSAGYAIGSLIRKTAELGVKLGTLTIGGAAAGVSAFIWSIIPLASKFEQFQVILENTEGSAAGAQKAMAWVKDFARTTPYEIQDVMEAFVQMKAYGIDPTQGALKSLGNTAAGMNKGLMQAVEMLADAQTGEFERLKEFGIKAKQAGGQVTFTYVQAGKEVKKTARGSAMAIQKALLGIFDQKFAGMMDRQSKTLAGMWSNLKDMVANFQLQIANAGVFQFLEGRLQRLLTYANQLAESGALQRWAQQISTALVNAATAAEQWVRSVDWKGVASDLLTVGKVIWYIVRALAGLTRLVVGAGAGIVRFFSSIAGGWDRFQTWVHGSPPAPGGGINFGGGGGGGAPSGRGGPKAPPVATGRPLGSNAPINAPLRPGAQRPSIGAWPKSADVGGSIDIRVKTDPGTRAEVTSMRSANPNVPINVKRGPVTTG